MGVDAISRTFLSHGTKQDKGGVGFVLHVSIKAMNASRQ